MTKEKIYHKKSTKRETFYVFEVEGEEKEFKANSFYDFVNEHNKVLIEEGKIFNGDIGGGIYEKKDWKTYPYILKNCENNLYSPIKNNVITYFKENNKRFWHENENDKNKYIPTGNTTSSQIACLNHLFLLRDYRDDVLKIAKNICPNIEKVIPFGDRFNPGYIAFEHVSPSNRLQEKENRLTSIDALIIAKEKDKILPLIIEWKYKEQFCEKDKTESLQEYKKFFENSILNELYKYNTFYQLMRQTLWVEQMITHKAAETIQAEKKYIHVLVIPKENEKEWDKCCIDKRDWEEKSEEGWKETFEKTWKGCLKDKEKFKIRTPEKLLAPILEIKRYENLIDYLSERYWCKIEEE